MEKEKHTRLENVMHHRIAWLRQWLQMRNYDIGDKRMTYLCICYCTLRAVQEQPEAAAMLVEINNTLLHPFPLEKLQKHILSTIDRNGILRYANQTIKKALGITDEEYSALDPDKNKRRLKEMDNRRLEKKSKENRIIQLHNDGFTAKQIAAEVGVSIKTVRRRIADNRKREAAEEEQFAQWGWSDFPILSEEKGNSGLSKADVDSMQSGSLYYAYRTESTAALGQVQLHPSELLTNTKENLLLMGAAGTGKSYLIQQYLKSLSNKERKKVLVLAPTWKAASNLGGVTVHSLFPYEGKLAEHTQVKTESVSLLLVKNGQTKYVPISVSDKESAIYIAMKNYIAFREQLAEDCTFETRLRVNR